MDRPTPIGEGDVMLILSTLDLGDVGLDGVAVESASPGSEVVIAGLEFGFDAVEVEFDG